MLLRRNLIPFFGAGFSAGAEALNGSVPDCTAAQEYMKKALIEENPECADYLAELDFTWGLQVNFIMMFRNSNVRDILRTISQM